MHNAQHSGLAQLVTMTRTAQSRYRGQPGAGQAVTRASRTLRGLPRRLPPPRTAHYALSAQPLPRLRSGPSQPPELRHPRRPGFCASWGVRQEARGPSALLPRPDGSHARLQADPPRAAGRVPRAPQPPAPAQQRRGRDLLTAGGAGDRGSRGHPGPRRRPNWGAGLRGRAPSSSPISPTPSIS